MALIYVNKKLNEVKFLLCNYEYQLTGDAFNGCWN